MLRSKNILMVFAAIGLSTLIALDCAIAADNKRLGNESRGNADKPPAGGKIEASTPRLTEPWDKVPAKFVMSMVADQRERLWVGTEDQGVFVYDPATRETTQFTTKDGLAENHAYALACDGAGRIWIGHQTRGVSVYSGEKWQNYEVVGGLSDESTKSGPLGERVFDIAVSPLDGDVWIATNLGLARYSYKGGEWSYFTRAEGLAADQINAVAVDDGGTVYAGTACDGLSIADPKDGYKKWRTVSGPLRPSLAPAGSGLPSALINDILVGSDGTTWVATNFGIALSKNKGRSWTYVRGADWDEKVKGLFGGAPKGWKPVAAPALLEDYTTCIAEDANGNIWIGHRQKPWEVIDRKTGARVMEGSEVDKIQAGKALKERKNECFVTSILPLKSGASIAGTYGGSMQRLGGINGPQADDKQMDERDAPAQVRKLPSANDGETAAFPSGARPPTELQLAELAKSLGSAQGKKLARGDGLLIREDWITKGDWVGRYGRHYSVLCAADAPLNHYVTFGEGYNVTGLIGPHATKGDGLRHWVHWAKSDNANVLWDPCLGHRRQAEWDDHGETYPMVKEGPDLWAVVEVPEGVHQVALYFFNKDGHDGHNRYRDYLVELKKWAPDYAKVEFDEPLAIARVHRFWGGNYKVFAVNGPAKYCIKVGRNYSFNTILSAVLVDKLYERGKPIDIAIAERPQPWMGGTWYLPPRCNRFVARQLGVATSLNEKLLQSLESSAVIASQQQVRTQLLRSLHPRASVPTSLLANWRWQSSLWTPADRDAFAAAMSTAWKRTVEINQSIAKD